MMKGGQNPMETEAQRRAVRKRVHILNVALDVAERKPGRTKAYYLKEARRIHDDCRELGRLFGYPECCIDQFMADMREGRAPAGVRLKESGGRMWSTEYVPCSDCLEYMMPSSKDLDKVEQRG